MQTQYENELENAAKANTPDEGFAYLKKAAGILEVVRHIDSMAIEAKTSRER